MPGPFERMVCLVGENPLPIYLRGVHNSSCKRRGYG
jgi:hypothetical protein